MGLKVCTKCGIEKELSEFYKDKSMKDGFISSCKVCRNKYLKNYRTTDNYKKYYALNNDDRRLYKKEYYKTNVDEIKIKQSVRNKSNSTKIREYKLNYYKTNKKNILYKSKQYKKANSSTYNSQSALRKANKLNATISGYDNEAREIYRDAAESQWLSESRLEVHHIIPLQAHNNKICGLHVPWNLIILTKENHLKAHEGLRDEFGK